MTVAIDRVWYVAYGSNLHARRFGCYLNGGRPSGAARSYPGCRDPRAPERDVPVTLSGQLYFAGESRVWTGGMAFYAPDEPAEIPARAYLVSAQQFSDVAAQEVHRDPGADPELDLSEVLKKGTANTGRGGRYDTLVCPGELYGLPLLTFTASWRIEEAPLNVPSPAYLGHLAAGLAEAHGWSHERCCAYLTTRPGASGTTPPDADRAHPDAPTGG